MYDPMKVDFVLQEGSQAITQDVRATKEGESSLKDHQKMCKRYFKSYQLKKFR